MGSGSLTMMSVGDIYLARAHPMSAFGDTAELLRDADFLFGNQEGPISDRGTPLTGKVEVGSVCLRAPLRSAQPLGDLGFSAVTLANNHAMDYGEEALAQTIDLLRDLSIGTTGGGGNSSESRRPSLSVAGDTRIAMLGYTTVFPPAGFAATDECAGVATIHVSTSYQAPPGAFYQPGTPPITVTIPDAGDLRQMTADIRAAHDLADLVVVQFHWGVAGYAYPLGYMREIGRLAVDTGADLVIGNHPHLLLGVEIYRGVPICYNLNHFAFDIRTPDWPGGHDALILKSRIQDKRFVEHALVPAAIDAQSCDLSLASPQRAAQVRAQLAELSAEFGTSFTPRGTELLIDGPALGAEHVLRAPDVYFDVPRVLSVGMAAARQIPTPP